jgi:iron-regulated transporter 1
MPGPSLLTAITLFGFLSLSRLGLWTFDLCVQELDQILVPKGELSSFAGTETAFASFFELGQWTVVAIFSDPNQFVWVAVVSLVAVGVATIGYAGWHLRLRGHLVHWDRIRGVCVGWGKK